MNMNLTEIESRVTYAEAAINELIPVLDPAAEAPAAALETALNGALALGGKLIGAIQTAKDHPAWSDLSDQVKADVAALDALFDKVAAPAPVVDPTAPV